MEHAEVLTMIGDWLKSPLSSGSTTGPLTMMWSSAFFSGLTDNIPLAAVLAKVLGGFQENMDQLPWFGEYGHLLWWSLIFGAGLGGNLTPIGSASTVVAISILKREGHTVTFMQYVKIGVVVVLVQLSLATGYLFAADKIGLIPKLDTGKVQVENGNGSDQNGTENKGHGK